MRSRLDYHVEFNFNPGAPGGDWSANAPDLPECVGQGSTAMEAETGLRGAIVLCLDAASLAGIAAPIPFGRSPFVG
jgi:predicted RNase H-like HicB family nuclease